MDLVEFEKIATKEIEKHIKGWKFEYDNAKKRAGCCKYGSKTITIAKGYVEKTTKENIMDTLYHEIAHAIVGHEHGHDQIWSAKAKQLGSNGNRCHNVIFTESKYKLKCNRGCWVQDRHVFRNPKGICKFCRGPITLVKSYVHEKEELVSFLKNRITEKSCLEGLEIIDKKSKTKEKLVELLGYSFDGIESLIEEYEKFQFYVSIPLPKNKISK